MDGKFNGEGDADQKVSGEECVQAICEEFILRGLEKIKAEGQEFSNELDIIGDILKGNILDYESCNCALSLKLLNLASVLLIKCFLERAFLYIL